MEYTDNNPDVDDVDKTGFHQHWPDAYGYDRDYYLFWLGRVTYRFDEGGHTISRYRNDSSLINLNKHKFIYDRDGYNKEGYDKNQYSRYRFHKTLYDLFQKDEITLDTNILMDPDYDILFDFLMKKKQSIVILSIVYEEVYRLKIKWGKEQRSNTRNSPSIALRRLVDFQNNNLLIIRGLETQTPHENVKVYADPELITYLKNTTMKTILFISNDSDVLIRSSQLAYQGNHNIMSGKYLLEIFNENIIN